MKLADKISKDTDRFDPSIGRFGDEVVFRWSMRQRDGSRLTAARLSEATGLDEEMFATRWPDIVLSMPLDIAVWE